MVRPSIVPTGRMPLPLPHTTISDARRIMLSVSLADLRGIPADSRCGRICSIVIESSAPSSCLGWKATPSWSSRSGAHLSPSTKISSSKSRAMCAPCWTAISLASLCGPQSPCLVPQTSESQIGAAREIVFRALTGHS